MEYQTQLCASNREKVGLNVSDIYHREIEIDFTVIFQGSLEFRVPYPETSIRPRALPMLYIGTKKVYFTDPDFLLEGKVFFTLFHLYT